MQFSLVLPQKVLFGCGESAKLAQHIQPLGARFLIVTSPSLLAGGTVERVTTAIHAAGMESFVYSAVTGEPSPGMVTAAADLARANRCDGVIGLGGGSVLDTAKAAAAIAANDGAVEDYLEGVGTGRQLAAAPLAFVAVPTTSGTGSEATKNAVISDLARGYKASMRSDAMMARIALVDPALTVGVPPRVTATSGMDALTQLIEAYLSKKAQPVTDALALTGLKAAFAQLAPAVADGSNLLAREGMAYGSLLSGICLANAGLGAVHGIAAALGAVEGVPHGLACAVLLPHVLALNLPRAGEKAAVLAETLTGRRWADAGDNAKAVLDAIQSLARAIDIPDRLGRGPADDARLQRLAGAVSRSSMGGNLVELSAEQVLGLIQRIL